MALALLGAGCASLGPTSRPAGLQVVAAERTWGSIAASLGGPRVHVTSIISSPAIDPHSYEPEAADARAIADADVVIVNGLGYDTWASQLLDADGTTAQHRLDVGALLGLTAGANPHRWYDPSDVVRIADSVTAALTAADPHDAAMFATLHRAFLGTELRGYFAAIRNIRDRFHGAPIGASESIVVPIASALGLRLVTPARLMRAVSDGADVSAADMATAERQIRDHDIRVWVLNTQNSTPNVQILTSMARSARIPVVTMTEMPDPASAGFGAWQTRQLTALGAALGGSS